MEPSLPPGLYIVATPIGNLSDLSPHAAAILSGADVIAVEDSRVTAKLLQHVGVKRRMPVNWKNRIQTLYLKPAAHC